MSRNARSSVAALATSSSATSSSATSALFRLAKTALSDRAEQERRPSGQAPPSSSPKEEAAVPPPPPKKRSLSPLPPPRKQRGAAPNFDDEWRKDLTIEERMCVRDRISTAYRKTCKSYEDLLATVVAIEEELLHISSQSRLDYFKSGCRFEQRVKEKRKQISATVTPDSSDDCDDQQHPPVRPPETENSENDFPPSVGSSCPSPSTDLDMEPAPHHRTTHRRRSVSRARLTPPPPAAKASSAPQPPLVFTPRRGRRKKPRRSSSSS